ncbi:MAG: dihydrofolate reductase [Gammaproteobacteria bacterium]|nr:dihydrofolate reductase [Gammaproteobacteria bacterium]
MTVSLIVAMAQNRVIGRNNALPWRLSPDLKRFRRITMGHPIVMGRKTYESIGRPLDGRKNIVISRNPDFRPDGVTVASSIDQALALASDNEIMIIGGADIYKQTLPRADRIHFTLIHESFDGDAYFPEINSNEWKETTREDIEPGVDAAFGYSFVTLERVTRNA